MKIKDFRFLYANVWTMMFVALVALAGYFIFVPQAQAQNCGSQFYSQGYFFDDYYQVEYEEGYLVLHLKLKTPYNDGRPWYLQGKVLDEDCLYRGGLFGDEIKIDLEPNTEYFSLRFRPNEIFEIWNDDMGIAEDCLECTRQIKKYPLYIRFYFEGRIDGTASTFLTPAFPLTDFATDPLPPSDVIDPLVTPPNCTSGSAYGYYFDDFQQAEYVDGLLRYHFRLKGPYNDERQWQSWIKFFDEDCHSIYSMPSVPLNTGIIPFTKHFSVRFTSPTHYEIWNEDTGKKEDCSVCSVDLPNPLPGGLDYSYVAFMGMIDGGASALFGTPYPVTQTQETSRDPVIIIPGITGTELHHNGDLVWLDIQKLLTDIGDDFLDVLRLNYMGESVESVDVGDVIGTVLNVFNYTTALKEEMNKAGYKEGVDLFVFPYDWRLGSDENSYQLKQMIDSIPSSKVDIIAHSMGGLVAKKYIQNYGEQKIDQLIFVGTPHLGSPKAGNIMLYGNLLNIMGISAVNTDTITQLGRNMRSLYELLPPRLYFERAGGYFKPHGNLILNYEQTLQKYLEKGANNYLLGQAEQFHSFDFDQMDLDGIRAYNINGCNTATLGKFSPDGDRLILREMVPGDGTVPLESSIYADIQTKNSYYIKGIKHNTMLFDEASRDLIISILQNTRFSSDRVIQDKNQCKLDGKFLGVFSPVNVKVVDQEGNEAKILDNGFLVNNIPGLTYDIYQGKKYLFFPTDSGQVYDVALSATDVGSFDMKVGKYYEGEYTDMTYYDQITITKDSKARMQISAESENTEFDFDFEGDESYIKISADAVLVGQEVLDELAPVTQLQVFGESGVDQWYRSDVQIDFSVSDEWSGVLGTKYSLDGDPVWTDYSDSVNVHTEGRHQILYYSTDRAGNREDIKTFEFWIDKTVPEIVLDFDLQEMKLIFIGRDELCDKIEVSQSEQEIRAVDLAGNYLILSDYDLKEKKDKIDVRFKKIKSRNSVYLVPKNKIKYEWKNIKKTDELMHFQQDIEFKEIFSIKTNYDNKKDKTKLEIKEHQQKSKKEQIQGLQIITIIFRKNDVKYEYR